jgi:rhodanese-related sulfurtransferase
MKTRRPTLVGFSAALCAMAVLCAVSGPASAKEPTWDDVLVEARSGGYRIITTEELRDLYFKAPETLLLVDTRQEWEYGAGHIRGAVNFPMEPSWWARWQKADALERLLGPDKHRLIVFY